MTDLQDIKYKWMDDFEVVTGDEVEEVVKTDFSEALAQTVDKTFSEGEVFNGKVISVGNDFVVVDIGYKQEGLIPVKEFMNYDCTPQQFRNLVERNAK